MHDRLRTHRTSTTVQQQPATATMPGGGRTSDETSTPGSPRPDWPVNRVLSPWLRNFKRLLRQWRANRTFPPLPASMNKEGRASPEPEQHFPASQYRSTPDSSTGQRLNPQRAGFSWDGKRQRSCSWPPPEERSSAAAQLAAQPAMTESMPPPDKTSTRTDRPAPVVPRNSIDIASGVSMAIPETGTSSSGPFHQPTPAELRNALRTQLERFPTGLQESHIRVLLGICREFDLVIALRPVSALAGYLIGTLSYPTKPMQVKAKTARQGPMAGHILPPSDAVTSSKDRAMWTSPESARAPSLPLLLTGERIHELLQRGLLEADPLTPPIVTDSAAQACEHLVLYEPGDGQRWHFRLCRPHEYRYLQSHSERGGVWAVTACQDDDSPGPAVQVLAHPELNAPYTADYDLLTFGMRETGTGSSPLNSQPPIELESNLVALANARRLLRGRRSLTLEAGNSLPAQMTSPEDPQWGNASPLVRSLVTVINACINRGNDERLNLVHHNADCHNPFSSEASIYPALFLLPNSAAMDRETLLGGARADANACLQGLHRLCATDDRSRSPADWPNWGAVWVNGPAQFNRLALTAHQHGYTIRKSQAWLGGELPRFTNSNGGIR